MKRFAVGLGFLAAVFVFSSLMPSLSLAQETPTPEPEATATPDSTATPDPIDRLCRSVIPQKEIPRCVIYKGKCQSGHIPRSDPRSQGIGLIINSGCRYTASQCINVYSSRGDLIGKMGAYPALYPYKNRAYSNFGCGRKGGNRATIDRRAKRLGNGSIYLRINNQRQCLKIGQVKVQVNSVQSC